MTDYYLRSNDETTMSVALESLPFGVSVDVIGKAYRVLDDETGEVEDLGGYYANVRSEGPIEWPESIEQMSPATPWRMFA